MIKPSTFTFMKDLASNNDKNWFDANRSSYEDALKNMQDFAQLLHDGMKEFDVIATPSGKKSLMRIYRDVRFSKDKSPYKPYWGGSFQRAGKHRRGGYYFHIQPGNCFIGGGFWEPSSSDLLHIRKQIQADPSPLRRILSSSSFRNHFGELQGEQVKSAPKGFDKDDPSIDLLRYKQFLVSQKFSDAQAKSKEFPDLALSTFRAMLPLFDYMTDILTHDLNGTPIPDDQLPG